MRLGAVVLAAGQSRRFGVANKLLHVVDGEPLLARVLAAFEGLDLAEVVVVTGYQANRIEPLLEGRKLRSVFNASFEEGMGSSLACGVRSLEDAGLDGLLLSLGDLPRLKRQHVARVIQAFQRKGGEAIVQPRFQGVRGHPVCFPKRCLESLKALSGDQGAREVLATEGDSVVFLDMDDDACVRDMDTP
ncbi:nucleotidyltransferase family protein [Pelagicoccus enzymogenes]|uniref:nucleotidyltransferase family protein n=1 Tax=Pelagicoccus enzymogenes TaxID=2773457 RepID=UPI00280F5108|nr:nucleotidyltransferase family protein [Pelagicoccus enzymogenes]MDQ8199092.1 nucleotidyltransferase family protein [Pelagicoccus enzymogenes]